MGGLLYKDFISIRGKRLVTGFSVLTLLMIIIKLIVASVGTPIGLMVENDEGEIFSFLEYLISMPAQMMPIMFLCFISN